MGRKFLTTITLPTLPSAPSSPSVGDMYFDTAQGKIGVYTASGWVYLSDAGGTDTTDFARKSENANITGSWTFSNTATFSATPTFSAGLNITGGTSLWTTDGWAKALDLRKGQALVWRTGGGLAIGLGVITSTNTLYLSSSTADGNSATASYPIVFDVENGRIGIGTTTPSEKIEVDGGNVKAVQLHSTASTGTAPLVVNSTTLVPNLNADLLDGYHASTSGTANTIAVRDTNGYITASGLIGPNTADVLIIRGPKYGVKVNIDRNEDYLSDFSVHAGVGYDSLVFMVNKYGNAYIKKDLNVDGDLIVGGEKISIYYSVALEKTGGGILAINGQEEFYGGVRVDGPGMTVTGDLTVNGTITGSLSGNASTATKLQTARNISLGGSLSGSTSFDGSANVSINASINAGAVGTTQLADNAVTTPKIADGSVTYAKLAQDVIDVIAGSGGTRIFQTTIGNGTDSTYTVTHNFNTTNVEVSLTLLSTNEKIGAKVEVLNSNQVRVSFISPIATNSVKVVVIG
jgi:hypothetical protein